MKNKTFQFAGMLALLAVGGKYYAVPAYAQVKAAIVQSRDEPARNFYSVSLSCQTPTFGYCVTDFPVVPSGKRLIIQHESALMSMPTAGTITSLDLRNKTTGAIGAFLSPTQMPGAYANAVYYASNENILVSFDAGQQPEFIVFTNSSANFTTVTTISGYMIDIP
ncbi:MAG: hypothetical protein JWP63_6238 [Candidatus Solibacter sp.]|nr:hypothetical protein [Candidatus Solibacter sp.]